MKLLNTFFSNQIKMVSNELIYFIVCYIIVIDLCLRAQAELFTAISDVKSPLETHRRVIDDLEQYIEKEEERLYILKSYLDVYKKEHEKAMEDIPNYLGNPINTFTLIKRLTVDLDYIEKHIKKRTEYIENTTMKHEDVKYPKIEDLTGAVQVLTGLKETYHLNIHDLSEGLLNGVVYSAPMTASDCYELGRTLYNQEDFKNALEWMKEAWRKYRNESTPQSFKEVEIIESIGHLYFLTGDLKHALVWTEMLLIMEPQHEQARENVLQYQKSIAEEELKLRAKQCEIEEVENKDDSEQELSDNDKKINIYDSLCRGDMSIPQEITKRLKCWFETKNHPFLTLAPLKVEQMYIDPDILVLYEVMSDAETEHIIELAAPKLKRATVVNATSGANMLSNYRISKSGWLNDKASPTIAKISQRVSDMTGLSFLSAEELQIVSYGIGGFYKPHYDFRRKTEKPFPFGGNRIATVLFYLSDVAQGGATVFTELGLSLFPVKGAAVFWTNLHPSGEGDMATRHAGCPVLRGTKWICTKWLHQEGQELLKPCNLEYQEEGILGNIPEPVPNNN